MGNKDSNMLHWHSLSSNHILYFSLL